MAEIDPYYFGDDGGDDEGGLLLDGGGENLSGDGAPQMFHLTESAFSGSMFERKVAARKVSDAFRQAYFTEQDVGSVLDVVEKLVEDEEQGVRTEVMEQIPLIAIFCHEVGPQLDYVVPQRILPCIVRLMTDKFTQVRKPTQTGLLLLLERGILAPSQVQEHIFPVIMESTAPGSNDDQRTEISAFMSKIAGLVGKDVTISAYLDRFCTLCEDQLFQVRRVCASSMGCFAGVLGGPLTENVLLPKFLALCIDDIWGVRKACAEVFAEVAAACQLPIKRKQLSPPFVRLLEDSSRWVRVAAYQTLGSLISTFMNDENPEPSIKMSTIEQEYLNLMRQKAVVKKPMKWKKMDTDVCKREQSPVSLLYHPNHHLDPEPEGTRTSGGAGDSQVEIFESNGADEGRNLSMMSTEQNQEENSREIINELIAAESEANSERFWDDEDLEEENSSGVKVGNLVPIRDFYKKKAVSENSETNNSQQISEETANKNQQISSTVTESTGDVVLDTSNESSKIVHQETLHKVDTGIPQVSVNEDHIHIHLEKESSLFAKTGKAAALSPRPDDNFYNTFQYWRVPVPEIELDIEMLGSKATNVHVRARVQDPHGNITYSSQVNLNLTMKKVASENTSDKNRIQDSSETEKETTSDDGSLPQNQLVTSDDSTNFAMSNQMEKLDSDETEVLSIDSQSWTSLEHNVKKKGVESSEANTESTVKTDILESNCSQTTVSIVAGNVSDVHRSYLNLFNPSSSDHGNNDNMRPPNPYDDDYYNDITSLIDPDDLPYILKAHGPKGERGRLLQDLPKSVTIEQQDIVPPALLEHFVGMCEPMRDHSLDSELANFCVYSLPAVVLTLGPQNWSVMRDCFESLACKFQWKIRFTLAASLHDIAGILGPELTERDLVPFYDAMTKDLDEVRIGILRNLAKFIMILGKTERSRCLDSLGSFRSTDNKRNWRFRLELTHQVEQLVDIYEAEEVFKHLCPLSLDLITDSVAEVRRSALDLVTLLVSRLSTCYTLGNGSEPNLVREFILQLVETLCHSARWVQRQIFATLSGFLIRKGSVTSTQFAQDILPHLVGLSTDKVPNVRLVVAQTLTYAASLDYFTEASNPHNEILMSTIETLRNDPDRDVSFFSTMNEQE